MDESCSGLPLGRQTGLVVFQQALRDALDCAVRQGWRELVLADADFGDWPLGERELVDDLHAWSRTGRRCTVLAADFHRVQARHARFASWRRTWSHLIECRVGRGPDGHGFPSLLWSPHWALHRIDPRRQVFVCEDEPARLLALREELDEILRESRPGFPASILGL